MGSNFPQQWYVKYKSRIIIVLYLLINKVPILDIILEVAAQSRWVLAILNKIQSYTNECNSMINYPLSKNMITQKRLHIIICLTSSTILWALHYKITTLYYVYIEFTKKCADTSLLFISSYDGILCLNRPFSVVHTIEHVLLKQTKIV